MSRDYHHEETYTHKCGKKYNVRWYYDYDMGSPLEWSDGHGVTLRLDWNPTNEEQLEQHILDNEPELEEETRLRMLRRLNPHDRYDSGLYYDVMASLHMARTEWGCNDNEACVAAVEADFKYIKGWYDNDWFWLTVGVAPLNAKGKPVEDYRAFCGGYESTLLDTYGDKAEDNAKYREEIINEQIHQVEHDIRNALYPNQMELPL
jgi:hypothetical protein